MAAAWPQALAINDELICSQNTDETGMLMAVPAGPA